MAQRKHITYDLKAGNKVVYRGITDNPGKAAAKHRAAGRYFTKIVITSRRITMKGAQKKLADALETYQKYHGGRNPRYNNEPESAVYPGRAAGQACYDCRNLGNTSHCPHRGHDLMQKFLTDVPVPRAGVPRSKDFNMAAEVNELCASCHDFIPCGEKGQGKTL